MGKPAPGKGGWDLRLKAGPGIGILLNIMRLSKLQLEHMSYTIARGLIRGGYVIVDNREQFRETIRDIIARELAREDALDEKVKEILREQQTEMSRANVHYHEMFRMVKAKLAEQEGIVL
mgnify:CR=1 FL=1